MCTRKKNVELRGELYVIKKVLTSILSEYPDHHRRYSNWTNRSYWTIEVLVCFFCFKIWIELNSFRDCFAQMIQVVNILILSNVPLTQLRKGRGPMNWLISATDIEKRWSHKLSTDTSRHAFALSWAKIKWAIHLKRIKMGKKKKRILSKTHQLYPMHFPSGSSPRVRVSVPVFAKKNGDV
jgi:hypothetical protein